MRTLLFAAALVLAPAATAFAHPGHDHGAHAAQTETSAETTAEETALRATIAAMQAGAPNYDDMVPELAEAVRAQEPMVTPMIRGFGALQAIEHQGAVQGAQHYRVTFENAATEWFIALDEAGKIAGLFFRPAG